MEKWSETADLTMAARLDQAEAFLRLRMMDRAWGRLKPLIEADMGGLRPYTLAARVFLDRGWRGKARKVIQQGLDRSPDDTTLQALWDEATVEPADVDTSSADDPEASIEALITVAEHFMTQGAFVRARSVLERVRRDESTHPRATELLWAIDGDYRLDEEVADVVERCAPDLSILADLADEGDHTESASLDDLPLQIERDTGDHFPALFRSLEPTDEAGTADDGEITAVSSLAEMKQLAEAHEAATAERDGGDDTQIMRVVRKAGGLEPVGDEKAHVDTPEVDKSFNLADFRREMGMQPPKIDSDIDFSDDEDDSVVVVTKREESVDVTEPKSEGLTLDTSAEDRAAQVQGSYSEERWADPSEPPPSEAPGAPTQPPGPAPEKAKKAKKKAKKSKPPEADHPPEPVFAWPWWLAVLALVMGFGVVMFGLLAIAFALQ